MRRRSFHLALPGVLWFSLATGSVASAAAPAVSLTQAIAVAQGGASVEVGIEVTLASAGQTVSAIQFDISYLNQAPIVSVSLGNTLTSAAKSIWASTPEPGVERLLIVGLNQAAIADGVLATLSVEVAAGAAPGVYPLGLTNAIAADPWGGPLPLSTVDGGVVVPGAGVPAPAISAVGNAASYAIGPVAPGEIVAVAGSSLADSALATARVTSAGFIATSLGSTTVLFDGIPAPLLYTTADQLSAIVPYEVSGQSQTAIQVEYQGVRSAPFPVPVALTSPAVFTLNESGAGQGAIVNQDGSINGPNNPAARGDVVSIYGTGEGQTLPAGTDGIIVTPADLCQPVQTVTVSIGGESAEVLYAGSAGNQVAGLLQVNARIPLGIAPGTATPVTITIGESSQTGVTMAVR